MIIECDVLLYRILNIILWCSSLVMSDWIAARDLYCLLLG